MIRAVLFAFGGTLVVRKIGPGPFDILTRYSMPVYRIPREERKESLEEIRGTRDRYPRVEEPFEEEH